MTMTIRQKKRSVRNDIRLYQDAKALAKKEREEFRIMALLGKVPGISGDDLICMATHHNALFTTRDVRIRRGVMKRIRRRQRRRYEHQKRKQ